MNARLDPKAIRMQQMKGAALGCFLPNIQVADGTVYGLLKTDEHVTHQYGFASKETLVAALREIYNMSGSTISLTSRPVKQGDGSWLNVNAIQFQGDKIVSEFSQDLAAYNLALQSTRSKG
jgi:hypothetical protein